MYSEEYTVYTLDFSKTFSNFLETFLKTYRFYRNEMIFSLNCLISGQTSDDIFNVPIGNFFFSKENIKVKFTDMTVANLKELLSRTDEVKRAEITKMNLGKVE